MPRAGLYSAAPATPQRTFAALQAEQRTLLQRHKLRWNISNQHAALAAAVDAGLLKDTDGDGVPDIIDDDDDGDGIPDYLDSDHKDTDGDGIPDDQEERSMECCMECCVEWCMECCTECCMECCMECSRECSIECSRRPWRP